MDLVCNHDSAHRIRRLGICEYPSDVSQELSNHHRVEDAFTLKSELWASTCISENFEGLDILASIARSAANFEHKLALPNFAPIFDA